MEQAERHEKAPGVAASQPTDSNPASLFAQWAPSILWMAALFVLSTSVFSAANTSKIIEPILRWRQRTRCIGSECARRVH